MTGSHDRRLARLEGALHVPDKATEEMCFVVDVVLGPERGDDVRKGGCAVLSADERGALIAAIDAEISHRDT